MVICSDRDADLHMAQLMPLPHTLSCSSKSRLILPFWYWLTRVVQNKWLHGRRTVHVNTQGVFVVVVVLLCHMMCWTNNKQTVVTECVTCQQIF